MRTYTTISLFVLLVLTASVSAAQAQMDFLGTVDSTFRTEILIGKQSLRFIQPSPNTTSFADFRTDFDPRVPLLAGTVEVSPLPSVSARFAGHISVWERSGDYFRTTGHTSISDGAWDLQPDVGAWELAGLYHLWNDGGYRFSVTGGYRREVWLYHGDGASPSNSGGRLREELASQIPFLGLQTSMFFPWWRARFEVLGSAFMKQKVSSLIQRGVSFIEYKGTLDQGGLLEFQMEGNVSLTRYLWTGLHARYTYQELRGGEKVTGIENTGQRVSFDLSTWENIFTVGLDLGVVF